MKEALKIVKGVVSVSDKITRFDFEDLAEDVFVGEIKNRQGTITFMPRWKKGI